MSTFSYCGAFLLALLACNQPTPTPERFCTGLGSLWFCLGQSTPEKTILVSDTACHCQCNEHTESFEGRSSSPLQTTSTPPVHWASSSLVWTLFAGETVVLTYIVLKCCIPRVRGWLSQDVSAGKSKVGGTLQDRSHLVARAHRAIHDAQLTNHDPITGSRNLDREIAPLR